MSECECRHGANCKCVSASLHKLNPHPSGPQTPVNSTASVMVLGEKIAEDVGVVGLKLLGLELD